MLAFLLACLPAPSGCGPGTQEVDGTCLPDDEDTETPDTGATDSDSDSGADSDTDSDTDSDSDPYADLTAVILYPCVSDDGSYGSHGSIWMQDTSGTMLGEAAWVEGDEPPVGFTAPGGSYYLDAAFVVWAPSWSSEAVPSYSLAEFPDDTYWRMDLCPSGAQPTYSRRTAGVDYSPDEVWVEFEAGLTTSYAESLLAEVDYTIVALVMSDPPAYILTSNAGLPSPAATLDITAAISRIVYAEPSPL